MSDRPRRTPVGPARVLALSYGFFVLAAGARSGVQIATKFSVAPFAYLLSAVAAAVYATGLSCFLLAETNPRFRAWAARLCAIELGGVLMIGLISVAAPRAFPDATVWSGFGSGYGYVPLVLPILGLCWAARGSATRDQTSRRRKVHVPIAIAIAAYRTSSDIPVHGPK